MLYNFDEQEVKLLQAALDVSICYGGDGDVWRVVEWPQTLEALKDDLNYPVPVENMGLTNLGLTSTQQRILGDAVQVGIDVLKEQQVRFSGGDLSRSYAHARLRILREVCDRLFPLQPAYEQEQLLSHLRNDTSALLRGLDPVGMSKEAALRAAHKELKDVLGKIEEVCEGTDILTGESSFD